MKFVGIEAVFAQGIAQTGQPDGHHVFEPQTGGFAGDVDPVQKIILFLFFDAITDEELNILETHSLEALLPNPTMNRLRRYKRVTAQAYDPLYEKTTEQEYFNENKTPV